MKTSAPPPPAAGLRVRRDLRERHRPHQRVSRGMVTVAPWIDVVLLIVFFLLCSLPFVTRPGIAIELPASRGGGEQRFGHTLVVVRQSYAGGDGEEIVFFDDRRFRFRRRQDALLEALRQAVTRRPDLPLIIEADREVSHGLLVELFDLAADAGIREVHIATRPFQTQP